MSQTWRRYTEYYLRTAQTQLEDWVWFDAEWPHIQRAWNWIKENKDERLLLAYFNGFYRFQDRRGLWQEIIEWGELCLSIIKSRGEYQTQLPVLSYLGSTYYLLGEMDRTIELYTYALNLAREIGDQSNEWGFINNLGSVLGSLILTRFSG